MNVVISMIQQIRSLMRINSIRLGLILLCGLLLPCLHSEPANILVANLTFTRPATWKWTEPTKGSSAVSRFVIPGPGNSSKTDVRFFIIKKDVETEKAATLNQFPGSSQRDLGIEEIKIGKQKVLYLKIEGTYQLRDSTPKPGQLLLGAAIPMGKEFVFAKLLGPRAEVEQQISKFKKMVETAIKERDVN
ncbi:MAG: hypothetical protein JWM68_5825 [Verrucomicrobiales bacterium]|nr:hypothetical protein [Verrucomicrobiales bacterium]